MVAGIAGGLLQRRGRSGWKIYDNMKKVLSVWISLLSLLLSVIAVCVAVWRSPELGFDYQGVLVGVLSLLVTVLIGWQICNFMYINKKVSSIDKIAKEVTKEAIDSYGHSVKSFVLTLDSNDLRKRNLTEYAIDNYIKAIEEGLKGIDEDGILLPLGYLELLIHDNEGSIQILKGKRHFYIEVLSRLRYKERKNDVIDVVIRAQEV